MALEPYNQLTPIAAEFCNKIRVATSLPIYFYGSIQRLDYIQDHSDVDVFMFSPNVDETVQTIRYLMNNQSFKLKKVVYNAPHTSSFIYGYKIKNKAANMEMSIFPLSYQSIILTENEKKTNLPLFVVYLLMILKYMYYRMGILSSSLFKTIKNYLLNNVYKSSIIFATMYNISI